MSPPTRPSADRLARVALARLGEPGDPRLAALAARVGPTTLLERLLDEALPASSGASLPGITGDGAEGIGDGAVLAGDLSARLAELDPQADLAAGARIGARFVIPGDPEWPPGLDGLEEAEPLQRRGGVPLGLWVRGPLDLAEVAARSVAVVGSRSATTYGTGVAGRLSAEVAGEGWGVVSGAAFGIDQAAHRGALAARGPTVAVLACGPDRVYPSAHRQLIDYIAEHGLVVTELPPGCAPTRVRFLARNRLIAAIGRGTVVVEAAVRSGALNTAHWTSRLHRPLMGVPGPVTSAASEGVHGLLRDNEAALVATAADILELVAPSGERLTVPARGGVTARDALDDLARQVLDAVPVHRAVGSDRIARAAGVSTARASAALGVLVEGGLVMRSGERYSLAGAARAEALAASDAGRGDLGSTGGRDTGSAHLW